MGPQPSPRAWGPPAKRPLARGPAGRDAGGAETNEGHLAWFPTPLARTGAGRVVSRMTRLSAVMGRNALDAFGQQITGRRMADVAQTEDADHPLALVDHWQPADLQCLHVPHRG